MICSQRIEESVVWKCSEDYCWKEKICCVVCFRECQSDDPPFKKYTVRSHWCHFDTFLISQFSPFCVMRKGDSVLRMRYGRCWAQEDVKGLQWQEAQDFLYDHHLKFHRYWPRKEYSESDDEDVIAIDDDDHPVPLVYFI